MHKLYDEDDELRKEFKDTFSGIHASEDLKARTLARMLDEEDEQEEESKSRKTSALKLWHIAVPAAALLCAVLVFGVFGGTPKPSYLTAMEDDVFYEEVKLKDGELHFVTNRVAISITPNAGGITVGQKQEEESDTAEAANEMIEEKEMADGGRLIYQKISAVDLPDIGDKNWSYIGERQIYITKLDTLAVRYQAIFEKDGQVYEVTGIGVGQKAFVDYLYQIVME